MNEIMQKLAEYLDAAESVVVDYAPEATGLVLAVIQAEAIFYLVVGAAFIWPAWKLVRMFPGALKQAADASCSEDAPYIAKVLGIGIAAFGFIAVAATNLLSFYSWLAAFNPLAGLVYKLIN